MPKTSWQYCLPESQVHVFVSSTKIVASIHVKGVRVMNRKVYVGYSNGLYISLPDNPLNSSMVPKDFWTNWRHTAKLQSERNILESVNLRKSCQWWCKILPTSRLFDTVDRSRGDKGAVPFPWFLWTFEFLKFPALCSLHLSVVLHESISQFLAGRIL